MGVISGIPREGALDPSLDRGRRQPREVLHRRLAGGNKPREILAQIFATLWSNSLKGVRILLFKVAVTSLPRPKLRSCSASTVKWRRSEDVVGMSRACLSPTASPTATGGSERARYTRRSVRDRRRPSGRETEIEMKRHKISAGGVRRALIWNEPVCPPDTSASDQCRSCGTRNTSQDIILRSV